MNYFNKIADVLYNFYCTALGRSLIWICLILFWPIAIILLFYLWMGIIVAFEEPLMQYGVFLLECLLLFFSWFSLLSFFRSSISGKFKRAILSGFIFVLLTAILQNIIIARFSQNPERFEKVLESYLK